MDRKTVQKLIDNGVHVDPEELPAPRTFNMAACHPDGSPANIICNKSLTIDIELNIRHVMVLILRGVRWLVTSKMTGEPLLGRLLLEALRLNIRDALDAAADRKSGVVDVSTLFI